MQKKFVASFVKFDFVKNLLKLLDVVQKGTPGGISETLLERLKFIKISKRRVTFRSSFVIVNYAQTNAENKQTNEKDIVVCLLVPSPFSSSLTVNTLGLAQLACSRSSAAL